MTHGKQEATGEAELMEEEEKQQEKEWRERHMQIYKRNHNGRTSTAKHTPTHHNKHPHDLPDLKGTTQGM